MYASIPTGFSVPWSEQRQACRPKSETMKFKDRLASLGFSSYEDYLASGHWQDFKARYRKSGLPIRCAVCGASPVQLHHHNYERLGSETFDDVTLLCRQHHVEIHQLLKDRHWPVGRTARLVAELSGRPLPARGKKKKCRTNRQKRRAAKEARTQARREAIERQGRRRRASDYVLKANSLKRDEKPAKGPPAAVHRRLSDLGIENKQAACSSQLERQRRLLAERLRAVRSQKSDVVQLPESQQKLPPPAEGLPL